jgi:nicotinamide mononucleotide transporter
MQLTPLEIIAAIVTLANVWLAVKENIWTWPAGIVSVTLYGFVNYQARLYSNAGLQLVYLVLSIHGWYEWLYGGEKKSQLRVRRASPRAWLGCTIAAIAGTVILLRVLPAMSAHPFWDASTTAVSLVAQWMLNEKLLENWLLWLIVDLVYVPLYFSQHLQVTAILYAIFCVLAVRGLIDWRRSMRAAEAAAP